MLVKRIPFEAATTFDSFITKVVAEAPGVVVVYLFGALRCPWPWGHLLIGCVHAFVFLISSLASERSVIMNFKLRRLNVNEKRNLASL